MIPVLHDEKSLLLEVSDSIALHRDLGKLFDDLAQRLPRIVPFDYINLVLHEGEKFGPSLIVRGSLERLAPVLLTALCAGLALTPLLLGSGEPGREILHPVAVTIFGGLMSSTLLDAVVTPTLFLSFGRRPLERLVNNQPRTLAPAEVY